MLVYYSLFRAAGHLTQYRFALCSSPSSKDLPNSMLLHLPATACCDKAFLADHTHQEGLCSMYHVMTCTVYGYVPVKGIQYICTCSMSERGNVPTRQAWKAIRRLTLLDSVCMGLQATPSPAGLTTSGMRHKSCRHRSATHTQPYTNNP